MSIDRGVIDQQLQTLGEGSGWWERRELRDLPAVLGADERILAISRGGLSRRDLLRRRWLIAVTDRRLLCLRSAAGSGWRQVELGAGQIVRTALRIGPFRARVLISASGRTHRLYVARADGYKLQSALATICPPVREAFSGFRPTLMMRRVIDHVLDLPAAALGPGTASAQPAPAATSAVDERVDSLEHEVEELRQQVQFLEQLLQEKHVDAGAQRLLSS